ncbi:MAG: YvcK family protein [Candidatus Aureabacteria bacterium]|nr:YvcK family protein [Candidatus Auribacterota bacterium]
MRLLKWFYPGMGVKRWWFACGGGLLVFGLGFHVLLVSGKSIAFRSLGAALLVAGVGLEFYTLAKLSRSLLNVFLPGGETKFVDILFKKTQLRKGPRITAIGGGTGLSVLLQGLKRYSSNLTAIVTVADDGGSSGRLRRDFNLPPPGDIRNCLVSLADAEPLMSRLFQYRFDDCSELGGHSFGNLFIMAMTKVTGDFEKAVEASSKVLAISGRVVPCTLRNVSLVARHTDGTVTRGEEMIAKSARGVVEVALEPSGSRPTETALQAISESDAIVLGPGSLYTSIIPNLLVEGMSAALAASPAVKIYVCNVMTQAGETKGYTASQHVEALLRHADTDIVDYVVCNNGRVPSSLLKKYQGENAEPVAVDLKEMRHQPYRVIVEDVISARDYVRHDPERLADIIIKLIQIAPER